MLRIGYKYMGTQNVNNIRVVKQEPKIIMNYEHKRTGTTTKFRKPTIKSKRTTKIETETNKLD